MVFESATSYLARQQCPPQWWSQHRLGGNRTGGVCSAHASSYLTTSSSVDTARRNLDPLEDRLSLIEDSSEVVPGVRAIATFGHTPGHIALSFASGGKRLLHVSDAVLYPLHLEHPEWTPVFDMLPEQAAASKRRIFDLAVEEDALVFAHHFPPFPNLGHVRKKERGWRWQPIETNRPLT